MGATKQDRGVAWREHWASKQGTTVDRTVLLRRVAACFDGRVVVPLADASDAEISTFLEGIDEKVWDA
eukprot:SAG31_NODE_10494_length_1132_cov_1.085189_1_plen_68_part_00